MIGRFYRVRGAFRTTGRMSRRVLRDLRWRAVSTELPDPASVVDLGSVEDGHVVVAAVIISLHVELLKPHLDDLETRVTLTQTLASL